MLHVIACHSVNDVWVNKTACVDKQKGLSKINKENGQSSHLFILDRRLCVTFDLKIGYHHVDIHWEHWVLHGEWTLR